MRDTRWHIFRKEAVENQMAQHGQVVLIKPIAFQYIVLSICLSLIVAIGYLAIGQYTKHFSVSGVVTALTGEIHIVATQAGVITSQHINEGGEVVIGDAIYEIRTDRFDKNGSVNKNIINSFRNLASN